MKTCAEIGVNHNGDYEIAKNMVILSKNMGFDACKFQNFIPEKLCDPTSPKASYHVETTGPSEKQSWLELLKSETLKESEYAKLFKLCSDIGIEFISTPYCTDTLEFLLGLGVETVKISSCDVTNIPLLKKAADSGKNVVLSTGMANWDEIDFAYSIFKDKKKLTILECISNYPLNLEEASLGNIKNFQSRYDCNIGYSDHTLSTCSAAICFVLGCTFYEKHITFSQLLPGPDHRVSLDPRNIEEMMKLLREAKLMFGKSVITKPRLCEMENRQLLRKGAYLIRDFEVNEELSEKDIWIRRPETKIPLKISFDLLGKFAKKKLKANTPINPSDFE